jgi:hypothetical protein
LEKCVFQINIVIGRAEGVLDGGLKGWGDGWPGWPVNKWTGEGVPGG